MKIIIAGAGAVGTHLAQLLAKESQNITLIDESEDKLSKVADNVDLMTLNVKPTSISGLKKPEPHMPNCSSPSCPTK